MKFKMSKEETNMIKRLISMALISLGVLLVIPHKVRAQKPEQVREEFHQTYPLSPNGRISLENIQGNVHITVWDRNEVKVDAVKTAYAQELLNQAEIDIDSTADYLRIHTQYPDGNLTFTNDEYRRNKNPATVEYTLTVPRLARLSSIELVNGNLDIEGVAGSINASSVNGRVTARNLKGEVKLATVNGNLEATFDKLDESKPVSVGSVNGNVVLIIPSDSNAILKAGTVHGGIDNDFGLPVRRGDYVGRELYGQLGRGGARLKLGNVNGSINIRRASDGRTLSPANSLINVGEGKAVGKGAGKGTGTGTGKADEDSDFDWDSDDGDAVREAARAVRDAQREAARAQREAERATREAVRAQQEAQRAVAAAQREADRVAREARQVQRDSAQDAREAQREIAEANRAAQAENPQAVREAQREAERAARDAERIARQEAQRAARVYYDDSQYRLVERDTTKLDVSGTPRINVETFDGALLIRGWDKPEVNVNVIKRASSEKGLRGIRYQASKNGNDINITASFDKAFAQSIAPGVTNINANVTLEIFVPRNVVLRASSGDGRLSLEGVAGELDLRTGDGSIDVVDGRGRVVAKTGDGRIRIANFNGAADAITGDGRINLEGRFTQLAARTGDGTITLALPADFNAYIETDAEKVTNEGLTVTEETNPSAKRLRRWKIGSGGMVITLRTGDGRVILQRAGGQ
jgi:DUF4097 and DUF4098 domain-containing protein YvlB